MANLMNNLEGANECSVTGNNVSEGELRHSSTAVVTVKTEPIPAMEGETPTGNFNLIDCPSREIKRENIDLEPEYDPAGECVAYKTVIKHLVVNGPKFHDEEILEASKDKGIDESVVGNEIALSQTTSYDHKDNLFRSEVKLYDSDTRRNDVAHLSVNNSRTAPDHGSNSMEHVSKLHKEDIKQGREKIQKSDVNCSTVKYQEGSFVASHVKLNEGNIEDFVESNTELHVDEIARSSDDNYQATVGNHTDPIKNDIELNERNSIKAPKESTGISIVEDDNDITRTSFANDTVIGNFEYSPVSSDMKLCKEEDIEDLTETGIEGTEVAETSAFDCMKAQNEVNTESEETLFQSTMKIEPVNTNYENNTSSEVNAFSFDPVFALGKYENSPITYDGSESRVSYDSSNVKLIDVSVVLEDLFLQVSKYSSQKSVQKHVKSKSCPCIFCARKIKPQDKLMKFLEANSSKTVPRSHHRVEGQEELVTKKWSCCALCPAQFRFMFNLRRHTAIHHHVYFCSECSSEFHFESDLSNHLKTHPRKKPHCCVFCSFKGRVEAELEIHTRIHSTEKFFSCGQCHSEFAENYSMHGHIQKHISTKATVKTEINPIKRSALHPNREPVINSGSSKFKQTFPVIAYSYKRSLSHTSCRNKCNQPNPKSNLMTGANVLSPLDNFASTKFIVGSPSECHFPNPVIKDPSSVVQYKNDEQQNKTVDPARVSVKNNEATELGNCASENLDEPTVKRWNSCTRCPAQFRFRHSLTRHFAINHRVYLCSECSKLFQLESNLQTHLKTHPASRSFSCVLCSFEGRVVTELEIHARTHSAEKLFSCAVCCIAFDKSYNMQNHIIQNHSSSETYAEFRKKKNIEGHSPAGKPVINDEIDGKDDASSGDGVLLSTNIARSVDSGTTLNKENKCAKEEEVTQVTISLPTMSIEKKLDFHNQEKSSLSTTTCKEVGTNHITESGSRATPSSTHGEFASLKDSSSSGMFCRDQQRHRTHYDPEGTRLVKVSVVLEDLFQKISRNDSQNPMQRHIDSLSCPCVFCTRKFKLHKGLKSLIGMKVKQDIPGKNHCSDDYAEKLVKLKWNSCSLCSAQFRLMHHLIRHSAVDHHTFLCQECPRKFQLQSTYKNHLKKHSVKRLFSCPFCSFNSSVEGELKKHVRIHSTEKFFSCGQCLTEFKENYDLLDHVRVHINAEVSVQAKNKTDFPISKSSNPLPIREPSFNGEGSEPKQLTSYASCDMEFKQMPHQTTSANEQSFECNSSAEFMTNPLVEHHFRSPVNDCLPSDVQSSSMLKLNETSISKSDSRPEVSTPSLACSLFVRSTESSPRTCATECQPSDAKNVDSVNVVGKHLSQSSTASQNNNVQPATKTEKETMSQSAAHIPEKKFICAICTTAFRYKGNLKQHILRHSNEKPFACPNCTAKFKSKSELRAHSVVHSEEKPFSCQYCPARFKRKCRLERHLQVHKCEKPFSCAICGAQFKSKCDIKRHLVSHSTERPFSCSDCKRTFKLQIQLKMHLQIHSSVKPFSCVKCEGTFTSELKLRLHLKNHSDKRPFSCSRCSATFKWKTALKRHSDVHLLEKLFSCPICSKKFKTKRAIATHLAVHSTDRPFSCSHCLSTFKSKSQLKNHSEVHSSDKPFACASCGAKCKNKKALKQHFLVHSSEKPFSCQLCSARFKKKTFLNFHLKNHTREKSYSCAICAATFKNKWSVKLHLAVHSTDRPYHCPQCNRAFKTKTHLRQHEPVHSKDRPFVCPDCKATFKCKREMKTHSLVHSSQRFSCPHCSDTFKTKPILKQHLHVHSNERPFACMQCDATFKTRQLLSQHSDVHTNERKFACDQCHRRFNQRRTLKSHLRCHMNERPFSCSTCAAAFKTKSELKTHSIVHSNQRPFSCHHCSATFKSKASLHYHQAVHLKEKLYSCAHCNASFKSKGCIKSHLQTHATAKPFRCKECNATFKTNLGLKLHAVSHSDERPFPCSKCGAAFKTKMSMRQHLITHSNAKPYACLHCTAKFKTRKGLKYHSAAHLKYT